MNKFRLESGDAGSAATHRRSAGEEAGRAHPCRSRPPRCRSMEATRSTQIEAAARNGQNLMPHIIHAVENYATVGEISDTLRKVFGEYKEAVVI